MLLYFGTLFLSKRIIGKPSSGLAVDWNTLFTMADGTSGKLGNIVEQFRADILRDLQKIKFSKFSGTAVQNEFARLPGSNVYIYQHKEYMQASSVELQSFGRACEEEISEACVPVFQCNNPDSGHDDDLLPFFHSNPELSEIYKIISNSNNEPQQRKVAVARYLDCVTFVETNREVRDVNDRRFHADNNTYYYSKDTWTKRLFEAVASRYRDDNVDLTAPLRGDSCNQAVLRRMPKGTPIDSLLFHGSPDIIIKYKPITVQEENNQFGIGCIETKKYQTVPYSSSSMIPQQAGQVICYIYQLLVAQIINKIMAGQVDTAGATGYGLYVMRGNGTCILFKVNLTGNPLNIDAKIYYGVGHKAAVLCIALNELASCHKN